jgi:DNA-binding MarR family transcriptional regulator
MESEDLDVFEHMASLLRATQRRTAARAGLPMVHSDILAYLSRCDSASDNLLAAAAHLGLTKGTVSQSVKLMVERDYLNRIPDEQDRRIQHLRLTEKGRAYIRVLQADMEALLAGVEISGAYARVFKTLLHDITRQAAQRYQRLTA